jgi:hypothetical protein
MSKLIATDEAVRVQMRKSELLNEGPQSLISCWNVLELEKHKQFPGRVFRDVDIRCVDDYIEMTGYLATIEEGE